MKAKRARPLVSLLLVGSILASFIQTQGTSYVTYTLTTTQTTTYTSWSSVMAVGTYWVTYVRIAITEDSGEEIEVFYFDEPYDPGFFTPRLGVEVVATLTSERVYTYRSPVMVVVTETRPRVLTVVSTYTAAPDVWAPVIGLVVIVLIFSLVGIVLFWGPRAKRTRTIPQTRSKRSSGAKVSSGMSTRETPNERFCRQFSIATAAIATCLLLIAFAARSPVLIALAFFLYIASGVAYGFTRRARWNRLRKFVYRRSGYTCEKCGITGVRLVAHHITPRYAGGRDSIENLTCLCEDCHARIHPWLKQ